MRADADLAGLYERAARATAAGSKSFYFATRFFPPDLARAAHSVYWFCRTTDDLVDECSTVEEGRRQLDAWQRGFERAMEQGWSEEPVLALFLRALDQYRIPPEYPRDLILGMRMDLDGVRYETFDDLRVFCYRVASVVGLMMCHVIGFDPPEKIATAKPYAVDLGIAMQLTNILRDVGEDLDRGRIYLPAEDLERFQYSEAMLRNRKFTPEFRELMKFQIARARRYYEEAAPGIPMIHRRGRFAVAIAADVYRKILHMIELNNYDSFSKRAVVPAHTKWMITGARLIERKLA